MTDQPPRIEKHEAWDRAGKAALRTAHDLGAALSATGEPGDEPVVEPVVVRTGGPHRSIAGLATLIDDALADAEESGTAERSGPPDRSPAPS
jgi:hypothetical protein